MIKVINKKNSPYVKGEYIGRPSILGNPYTHLKTSKFKDLILVKTRNQSVEFYDKWLEESLKNNVDVYLEFERLVDLYIQKSELNLICWCDPLPCHGHILREYIFKRVKEKFQKRRLYEQEISSFLKKWDTIRI